MQLEEQTRMFTCLTEGIKKGGEDEKYFHLTPPTLPAGKGPFPPILFIASRLNTTNKMLGTLFACFCLLLLASTARSEAFFEQRGIEVFVFSPPLGFPLFLQVSALFGCFCSGISRRKRSKEAGFDTTAPVTQPGMRPT